MASHNPFRLFRKYKKQSLVAVTFLAIVAFVMLGTGGVLTSLMSGGGAAGVAVKTDSYGNLSERQLSYMIHRQRAMSQFARSLASAVLEASMAEGQIMDAQTAFQFARSLPENPPERWVVREWLLTRHAEDLGVVITDDEVNAFLRSLTRGKLSNELVVQLLRQAGLSQGELFAMLKEQLAAQQLIGMFSTSIQMQTPGQRWDAFLKLNLRAKIEAAVVPVEAYVDQIPNPDEDTIEAFFEKHRYRYFQPDRPEPGFRQPTMLAVEYVKAPLDAVDPMSIPMAEVEAYYEENKDRFRKIDFASGDPGDQASATADRPGDLEQQFGTLPGLDSSSDLGPATKQHSAPDAAETPEAGDSSARRTVSPFRFTAMQTAEQNGASSEPPSEPTDASSPDQPAPSDETDPAAEPNETARNETPPNGGDDTGDAGDATTPDAEERPVEYRPLEDVEDEIRRTLAREKVMQRVESIQESMEEYRDRWFESLKNNEPAPRPLDLKAMAVMNRFEYGRTPRIPQYEMIERDIAAAEVEGPDGQSVSVVDELYRTAAELTPGVARDLDNVYLYWIVERSPDRVPKLDDEGIRQEVVEQWKQIQARDLAREAAEQLAAEAKQAGKPLEELFAGREDVRVVETLPFTWMDYGGVPSYARAGQMPRISAINEINESGQMREKPQYIVAPGNDFMKTVFGLEVGEVGVAMNQPKTAAYVIRLVDTSPDQIVLWSLFKTEDINDYAQAGLIDTFDEPRREWFESLEEEAGLEWVREPQGDAI